ncbi:MAG: class I SAM-dependent methyltransferase [Kofleriaceae bacterium]
MDASPQRVEAGQAVYTPRVLSSYDLLVLKISNRLIWRCPSPRLQELYDRLVSERHLEVGIGTGYFLDRARAPALTTGRVQLSLLDLNANALEFGARRLARYRPATYRRNALEPFALPDPGYDSIGVNYLLHCLPGRLDDKCVVFDHAKAVMRPGATVFGSTLLQGGVRRSWSARALMALYNAKGIFSNRDDDLETLRAALTRRFRDVELSVTGCAAVFVARAT